MKSAPKTTFNLDQLIEEQVGKLLLQSADPIIDKIVIAIRPIIADYILAVRKQLSTQKEFVTIATAAKKYKITRRTIYNWLEKGVIESFVYDGKLFVALHQIEFALQNVYQPQKIRNKSHLSVVDETMI